MFFEEELDDEFVEACVDVPVDEADVVAGGVLAVLVEFDGLASAFGAAFALELAGEELGGADVEGVEPGGETGVDELVDGAGLWGGGGDAHGVGVYGGVLGRVVDAWGLRWLGRCNCGAGWCGGWVSGGGAGGGRLGGIGGMAR